ncbi:MAG: SDR family oxidoreductase [Firmicutes bacterium]|nr:SDR family oxidoreductase [Bacillota bacterium]
MDLGLQGKTIVVMGASRGLGKAVKAALVAEGATVIGTSRRAGQEAVLDTADPASRAAFLAQLADTALDGVFVNTGGPKPGDFGELSEADWIDAFQQVLLGPAMLVRQLLPQVREGGALLFNTSSSIKVPIAHLLLSNVFRAGVWALVKSLVDELSPRRIRVNVIVPGRIQTERLDALDRDHAERAGVSVEAVRGRAIAAIPLGRYGQPEEFGRLAAFLLSPQASFLNGASFWVDGGQTRSL